MNFDKMSYLFWSIFVLISMLGVAILGNYGNMISEDKSFQTYFGWYIGLFIANLFNILVNLIFHFFMKDIEGKRGLKGEPGLRGKEGTDALCFCSGSTITEAEIDNLGNAVNTATDSAGIAIATPVSKDGTNKIGTVLTRASDTSETYIPKNN